MVCYMALVLERLIEYKAREAGIKASTNQIEESAGKANVVVVDETKAPVYIKAGTPELFDAIGKLYGMEPLDTYNKKKKCANISV
ncbi:MAG: hypothetical protein Q4D58_12135 [Synergistaceae bacterium]|nr:hypothetical protein [Synergistaceae bacterium]